MKEEAEKLGALSLLCLKYFCHTDKTKMVTSELDCEFIQELVTLRYLKNNGMSRGEVIGIIQTITDASFLKTEQHCYYFRKSKMLPKLRNHGALQTSQATTTKRGGVITEKLLCWNRTVDDALEYMDCRDSWHSDWGGIK